MTTGFVYHPQYMKHLTGMGHPECPERLPAILDALEESAIGDRVVRHEPAMPDEDRLLLVHPEGRDGGGGLALTAFVFLKMLTAMVHRDAIPELLAKIRD